LESAAPRAGSADQSSAFLYDRRSKKLVVYPISIRIGQGGYTFSQGFAVNDNSTWAGGGYASPYNEPLDVIIGVPDNTNQILNLGPGVALGINNSGQVVGRSGANRAFLSVAGSMADLPPLPGCVNVDGVNP